MRVRVKLVKSVATLAGTFQQFTGELDPVSGICWLDESQGGRRVPAGMGIKVSEGATVQKLDLPAPAARAKPGQPKEPTAS
jgi:hypothetical protein